MRKLIEQQSRVETELRTATGRRRDFHSVCLVDLSGLCARDNDVFSVAL